MKSQKHELFSYSIPFNLGNDSPSPGPTQRKALNFPMATQPSGSSGHLEAVFRAFILYPESRDAKISLWMNTYGKMQMIRHRSCGWSVPLFCYDLLFYPAEFEIWAFQLTDGSGFPVGSRGRVKCLLWQVWQKCVRRMTRHINHNSPCRQATLIFSCEWPCVDILPIYILVIQHHERGEG